MAKKMNFEERIDELQNIVIGLEQNEIPLKEALAIFERSQKLIKECETELKSAETKLKRLVKVVDIDGAEQLKLC